MRRIHPRIPIFLTCVLIALLWTGCTTAPTARRAAPTSRITVPAVAPADTAQCVNEHCIGGAPVPNETVAFGQTVLLCRDAYALEHNSQDKAALWVCWHLTKADVTTPPRGRPSSEPFKADPDLAAANLPRAELADYRGSGYSRGHQCPSADYPLNSPEQAQTYYLSNMTPQYQAVNGGIWAQLEKLERKWATDRGSVYVITGPLFCDPADDAATPDSNADPAVIGTGVAVPTHYYKIVVTADAQSHPADMVAFVIPNVETWTGPSKPEGFRQSVRWIEAHAGLNFMPDEASPRQDALETRVSPMWK